MGLLDTPSLPRVRYGTLPPGLNWSPVMGAIGDLTVEYGRLGVGMGNAGLTPQQAFNAVSTALTNPGALYYVSTSGSDTNPGTKALPFRSMLKATQAANAGGVSTQVWVTGYGLISDIYSRTLAPSYGGVSPTVDIAWLADGVVCTGPWDQVSGQSQDATYTNTYSWSLGNAESVWDLTSYDRWGQFNEFKYVATEAICNRTPDSWTLVGGKIYVNRRDGLAVTGTNTRAIRGGSSKTVYVSSRINVYFGPAPTGGRWVFHGGGGSQGPFVINMASAAGSSNNVVALQGVTVIGGGSRMHTGSTVNGGSTGSGRAYSIEGLRGLLIAQDCSGIGSASDTWNIHNATGVDRTQVLLVNCGGFASGRDQLSVSNNHLTTHETGICMIVVGGVYDESRGGLIRNIDASRAYVLGTRLRRDDGDWHANGLVQSIVRMGNTSKAWLEACLLEGLPGQNGAQADETSEIYMMDCESPGLLIGGSGTVQTVSAWPV